MARARRDDDPKSEGWRPPSPFDALRERLGDLPEQRASMPPPEPPAPPRERTEQRARVSVRRERTGRGGKTVTLAEGPGLAGTDLAQLAREASSALGLGARAEGPALVVQGDQRERLATWLRARGFAPVTLGN